MAKTKEYSATNKAPGIKEHILAALVRPMMVREIAGAIGSTTESVSKAIALLLDEGYALHTDELGRLSLTPPAVPKAPTVRTIREYEAMENPSGGHANGNNGNGQESPAPVGSAASNSSMLPRVAISNIRESSINPRKAFNEGELAELAESIGRHGVLEPLLLRPNPDGCNPPFELLAGARRFRACKIAGVEQVPAVVRKGVSDAEAIEIMLAENEDRADLNPVERARAYQALQDAGYTQQSIAERIKRSQPVVANTLRLLTLSEELQAQVAGGTLSEAHGRALLRHPEGIRDALAAHAVEKSLPSRAIDIDTAKLEWSVVYALRDAGAVRVSPHFEMCSACPHGALICAGSVVANSGWCVNPACYDELEDAIKANVSAANVRVLAEARDIEAVAGHIEGEAEVPTLAAIGAEHPDYRSVADVPPAGCSGECECRRQAQQTDMRGSVRILQICINPERMQSLRDAETADREERRRQEFDRAEEAGRAERESLIAAIQSRSDDPALLAAVVGRLVWTGEMDLVPEVLTRLVPDVDLDFDDYCVVMDNLAALPPATLIRIAGELALLEPDEPGLTISHWFQERPAAAADPEQMALSDTLTQLATLKIELRNVQGQLEHAQKLLQGGTLDSRSVTDTERLLTESRQQVEARERTIAGLEKQIEHMRQARERVETPAPRVADELVMGMRMIVTGAIRKGMVGEIKQVSHYRDFYLLHPDDTPGHFYTDEWFCVSDLEPAPKPAPEPPSAELPPEMLAIADEMHTVAERMDTAGFIIPDGDPAEIEIEGDLIECGDFVRVVRPGANPDLVGAVGRVVSLPNASGRVVVHFEDGEEWSLNLGDLQRVADAQDLDTPGGGPDCSVVFTCASCGATADPSDPESGAGDWPTESFCQRCSWEGEPPKTGPTAEGPAAGPDALDYAAGMRMCERHVFDGRYNARCPRCGKKIIRGNRFVSTLGCGAVHATCLTHEERMAFEGRDPIRPVSPAGIIAAAKESLNA